VIPPKVNKKMNPILHSIDASFLMLPPFIVVIQLNTLIPVGIAMIIVAAVKYARVSTSIPTVNIWCAQTMNPIMPMDDIA